MSEAKPFASLSSGLLARKGAAKPAMRPQGFNQMGMGLEDLGWNDMGHAPPSPALVPTAEDGPRDHVPSSIAALTPAPRPQAVPEVEDPCEDEVQEQPGDCAGEGELQEAPQPVLDQHRAIEARFADFGAEPAPDRNPARAADVVALPPRPRQQAGSKAKAAFTLRLDEQRHLKLRLACAVMRRSAQQLVSEALDDFLAGVPELDRLAEHVPAKLGKRN
ncbi:MAG TPA: hypothetical protein VGW34_00040 [Allosphingosinicella sp.]|nr:hypothetical protein [Allosphingosinicella sp.]